MSEQDVGVVNQLTAAIVPVRTIQVVTPINGVPTTVQMEVVAVADESGNIIKDFATYNLQVAQLAELRAIRRLLALQVGVFDVVADGPYLPQQ